MTLTNKAISRLHFKNLHNRNKFTMLHYGVDFEKILIIETRPPFCSLVILNYFTKFVLLISSTC
jgi:hypothetical protein